MKQTNEAKNVTNGKFIFTEVQGTFVIGNSCEDVTGLPLIIKGDLVCSSKNLRSFAGAKTERVTGYVSTNHCQLDSFEGFPKSVGKLIVEYAKIKDFSGIGPVSIGSIEVFAVNDFENLKGLEDANIGHIKIANCKNFESFEGFPTNSSAMNKDREILTYMGEFGGVAGGSIEVYNAPKLKSIAPIASVGNSIELKQCVQINFDSYKGLKHVSELTVFASKTWDSNPEFLEFLDNLVENGVNGREAIGAAFKEEIIKRSNLQPDSIDNVFVIW